MKTFFTSLLKMSTPKKVIVTFILLVNLASTSFATIYYVSSRGSDVTGNGTAALPWKTLFKATSTVRTVGDIIHLNAGTYIESNECILAVGVSVEGQDSSTTILKSSLTADWFSILALESTVEGTNGNQRISNLKFDGQNLTTDIAITITARSNVKINNCKIVDFRSYGVIFSGINSTGEGRQPVIYATGNEFYNNTIINCSTNSPTAPNDYGRGCFNFGGQQGMLIHDNYIEQPYRTLNSTANIGWPIKYSNDGYIKDCKIYNNTLKRALFRGLQQGENNSDWNFSFEMWNVMGGLEMYGNTFQGVVDIVNCTKVNSAYGLWFHDNAITYPTKSQYYQAGIQLETNESDILIENNRFSNMMQCIEFSPRDYLGNGFGLDIHRVTIRKNLMNDIGYNTPLMVGNANFIAVSFDLDIESGLRAFVDSISIYNNTIISTQREGWYYGIRIPTYFGGASKNVRINNNIIQGFMSNAIWANPSANVDSVYIKNNDFFGNGSNTNFFSAAAPVHYFNSGNTVLNPMLDAAFKPLPGSPMIDAGVYVGIPYSGAAPDKGFIEFTTAPLPVKLIEITVSESKGNNILQWKTATEINSSHFIIERSNNGQNFKPIGTVKAAGISSTIQTYQFTDESPLAGTNFYRLVMVDRDNSKELSDVVYITSKVEGSIAIISAQLSASNKTVALTVTAKEKKSALLNIFDNTGRLVFNEVVLLQKGVNTISKNTQYLTQSIYYIKLVTADEMVVKNTFPVN
jgi:hypothetical protein